MLKALTQEERIDLIMSVGVHKKERRVSPIEVAELIIKSEKEQSLAEIAQEIHLKSDGMLRKFKALKKLPQELQALVNWNAPDGFLSFSTAFEITRLENLVDVEFISKAALENSLTKEEVQAIIQRAQRGNVSVQIALDEILKLRPIVERQYLFVGLVPKNYINEFEPDEIRRRLRIGLAKIVGASNILSVSCRGERYSFMLSKSGLKLMADAGYQLLDGNLEEVFGGIIEND
jgi:hypothetical protein